MEGMVSTVSPVRRERGLRADTMARSWNCAGRDGDSSADEWAVWVSSDEFQFLSDARHLDWGFVAYPPLTPFVERIGLEVFGVSLVGLRLFSVIAQALAIVVTGLMAWELGGGRLAQVTAALVVATSGLPVFEGTEFQYSSFDYLCGC